MRRVGGNAVAAAFTEVRDILKSVSDIPLWSNSDAQITELLIAAARLGNQVEALRLRVVAEAHGRDIAGRAAASSTRAWLRNAVLVSPAEAKKQVALAGALRDLEPTRRALTDGLVSASQAQVIAGS
ncbi:MAG: DUF222 domain-containing protein, partial [Micromonosporaceae bacterium]